MLLAAMACAASGSKDFVFPDGSSMQVSLVGEGDAARVTYVPKGANQSFQRYQGYINESALETHVNFTNVIESPDFTALMRPGWSLNVSHKSASITLTVNGVVVSRDLRPPATVPAAKCDPPGWKGLAPGIGTTVAPSGSCLSAVRSLSPTQGVLCCTSYQDPASHHPTGPCNITCPASQTIETVDFADYGTAIGSCGRLRTNPDCTASNDTAAIMAMVRGQCVGKSSCSVARKDWPDPCRGEKKKRLTIEVRCAGPSTNVSTLTEVENEQIFGFGQTVTKGLSVVGKTKFIATFSRTLDTGPSHAPAPSYISLAQLKGSNASVAHGFFLNTHGYSAFDVGADDSHELHISTPDPIYDYFIFAGPTPAKVVSQFSNVAGGRISLPPTWAMGMKYDPAEGGDNSTFVASIIEQFADHGIRPDRAILEPAWQGAQYSWDTKKFPDVPALIKRIAPTKLILWEHPILSTSTAFYKSLDEADCLARAGPAAANTTAGGEQTQPSAPQFSDLTLPRCQALWKSYQLNNAIASGAMGFKLDEDDVDKDVGFNDSALFPSGLRGYEFHNIEGYIWQRLYHEMFESLGKRTWLQSRGGYVGSQAYPTNSYSDGYDYPTYVRGVVNSGFSGLIWAPEMRHATCTPEHTVSDHADFARRTQLMFLSPQAQYNAWDGRDGTTVWPCGDAWMAFFKTHYDLRTGLKDYIYSAFEEQSRTGLAVARPLVLDSPDDQTTWYIDDQYMFGAALMFPPAAMDGNPLATSRQVYFPKTAPSWHPWFNTTNATAAVYEPGTWAQVPTPVMTVALFVKGGVPLVYRCQDDGKDEDEDSTLQLRVWVPPASAVAMCNDAAAGTDENGNEDMSWAGLYSDDGESTRYRRGEFWRGKAGFGSCRSGAPDSSGRLRLRLRLDVEHAHAGYSAPHRRVRWELRGLTDAPTQIRCAAGIGNGGDMSQSYSGELGLLSVTVTLPVGHDCAVGF